MWSNYNNNSNSSNNNNSNSNNNNNPPRQQSHHHSNNNEYEDSLISRPHNTNNDPLSALAAYTLDPSANATAFATVATAPDHQNSSEYYYSSSSPTHQQNHHYHRDDPHYLQKSQNALQQQQQHDWGRGQHHHHRDRTPYDEYEDQEEGLSEEDEQEEEDDDEDDELANINQNIHPEHRQQQQQQHHQAHEEEEESDVEQQQKKPKHQQQHHQAHEEEEESDVEQQQKKPKHQQQHHQAHGEEEESDVEQQQKKPKHQQQHHQAHEEEEESDVERQQKKPKHQQQHHQAHEEEEESDVEQQQKRPKLHINNPKVSSISRKSISSSTSNKNRMPSLEYECVATLLEQFCKVPLLAEFSRPVSKLHPELMSAYTKVVKFPMDLSKVCRRFHRHFYSSLENFQVDMWRIFTNCILFHSHPTANKNGYAIPSFISLALHLREFFNALWQEYVIPSDVVSAEREDGRKLRLYSISTTLLTLKCMKKAASTLHSFIESRGCVDRMDKPVKVFQEAVGDNNGVWTKQVHYALKALRNKILQMAENNESLMMSSGGIEMEYSMENLSQDLDSIAAQSPFPSRLQLRLHRLLGKIVVPIYETNCRGVNQSSIWGCMAAAIWARESAKKRFWPALVLGILAPDDQKEDWHVSLTERNEARLPVRLRQGLQVAKRKAEAALEKQTYAASVSGHSIEVQSYFLVEFMGKHEFTWVREADIIESFDPSDDPNTSTSTKKRSSNSTSDTFVTAVEEGKWALEEFEMQLRDPCGDLLSDGEADDDEDQAMPKHTSFKRLWQPQPDDGDGSSEEEDVYSSSFQTEELEQERQELLANNGLIDFSIEGRKVAKKTASEIKESRKQNQQTPSAKKSHKKKAITVIDEDKERRKIERQIELEKKRVEKEVKAATAAAAAKKKKSSSHHNDKKKRTSSEKKKTPSSSNNSKKISDKRYRAEMVIQGYLSRIAQNKDSKDLSLSVFMNPDSFGLLGMALAFRAAANDIEWNDPSDPQNLKKSWEKLQAEEVPTSCSQRCALLKNQIVLVENELEALSKAQERRRQLMDTAEDNVGRYFNKMMELDQQARIVPSSLKRKKKPASVSSGGSHMKIAKKPKNPFSTVVRAPPINNESEDEDEPISHVKINQTPAPTALEDEDASEEEAPPVAEVEDSLGESDEDDEEEDERLNDVAMSDDLESDEEDD